MGNTHQSMSSRAKVVAMRRRTFVVDFTHRQTLIVISVGVKPKKMEEGLNVVEIINSSNTEEFGMRTTPQCKKPNGPIEHSLIISGTISLIGRYKCRKRFLHEN